jgi:hypothetical protein
MFTGPAGQGQARRRGGEGGGLHRREEFTLAGSKKSARQVREESAARQNDMGQRVGITGSRASGTLARCDAVAPTFLPTTLGTLTFSARR